MTAAAAFQLGLAVGLGVMGVLLFVLALGLAAAASRAERAAAIERRERAEWERAMCALTRASSS